MTIIAYRDGIMACDSCHSTRDVVDTLMCKIHRLKSGALIGFAGDNDARDVVARLNAVKSPRQFPMRKEIHELRIDSIGLLVFPNGRIFKFSSTSQLIEHESDDVGVWEIAMPFAAVGSGEEVALGAMAAGASARRAASIACRYITTCRPPIHTRSLR